MLWSEVHGGKILRYLLEVKKLHVISVSIILLVCISLFAFRRKRRVVYLSIFTTGFSSMAFMLVIVLSYQASYGYVYEMIGILTATFMIGLFAGAYLSRHTTKALQTLFHLEIIAIILAISASIFFKSELLFYVLNFLLGMIAGRQFSTANLCMDEPQVAGKLYGIDLIGSFLGALIPSIVLVPLFGIFHTLLFIVGIKTVSAMMILSVFPFFLRRG
jgi:hypothetical protein